MPTPPDLPRLFSRQEAESFGLGRRPLEELLRLGAVRRVHRGLYAVERPVAPGAPHWQLILDAHLDALRAHLRRFPGHVASHTTAALVHGLATVLSPASPVEITAVDSYPHSWREPGLTVHHGASHDIPVEVVDGLRVTAVARTVADTMRTRSLAHGTAILDDALRQDRVTRRQVLDALALQKRWRGRPRALAGVSLADPRRETWLESYSFVELHQRGCPLPLPQVDVYDEDKSFLGRVDGLLPESSTFWEADGQEKYFLGAEDATSPQQAVIDSLQKEGVRHAGLEGIGLVGVRWTSHEILTDPESVVGRVRAASRRAPARVRGYVEWQGELRRLPFEAEKVTVDLWSLRTRRRPTR